MTKEIKERVEFVKAMDLIARSVNDEDILDTWFTFGVADGSITEDVSDEEIAEMWCDDGTFKILMDEFTKVMHQARRSGGLYCGKISGGER